MKSSHEDHSQGHTYLQNQTQALLVLFYLHRSTRQSYKSLDGSCTIFQPQVLMYKTIARLERIHGKKHYRTQFCTSHCGVLLYQTFNRSSMHPLPSTSFHPQAVLVENLLHLDS